MEFEIRDSRGRAIFRCEACATREWQHKMVERFERAPSDRC